MIRSDHVHPTVGLLACFGCSSKLQQKLNNVPSKGSHCLVPASFVDEEYMVTYFWNTVLPEMLPP